MSRNICAEHVALNAFLSSFEIKKQKKQDIDTAAPKVNVTHTTFGYNSASYSIPDEKLQDLYKLLDEVVFNKKIKFTLVERPKKTDDGICVKPMVIDLDFRFSMDSTKRQYSEKHIEIVVNLYNKAIKKYVDITDDLKLKAYIFERNKPYNDSGYMKDGIHIIYPELILNTKIQLLIRDDVISNFQEFINTGIPLKNSTEDVVDKSVIETNGWILYGCTKKNIEPYELTHIYLDKYINETDESILIDVVKKNDKSSLELIEYLSIRKPFIPEDEQIIKSEYKDKLLKYSNKKKDKIQIELSENDKKILDLSNNAIIIQPHKLTVTEENKQIDEAHKLCELLSDRRSHDYYTWIEVGMCLYNISTTLKETWIKFSKRSHKFDLNKCEDLWDKFKKSSLSIGSLHLWASLDNPIDYGILRTSFLSTFLYKSISGTTQDISQMIYEMYKHKFVYVPQTKGQGMWYEFSNHKWGKNIDGTSLKKLIGKCVLDEYMKLNLHYNNIFLSEEEEDKKNDIHDKIKKVIEVTFKIRDISFKNKLMDELRMNFSNDKFLQNLDTNMKLIGFNNGIYDLNSMTFRDGRPEDYVSLSTQIDYPDFEYNDEEETIIEINNFFKQIFPNSDTLRYTLKLFASFLDGNNPNEEFYVFTGGGGNGKSKLIELFNNVMGDYVGTVSVALITNKRGSSSAASPELHQLIGKRFAVFQEPTGKEEVNIGLLKEMTGGDRMNMRPLFGDSISVKLQAKYALLCNVLPKIDANDDGTWRRMRVVPFKSKFVDNPSGPYEFKRDNYLSDKMKNWKNGFILILMKYYAEYINDGGLGQIQYDENGDIIKDENGKHLLKLPFEVSNATFEYKKDSDIYSQFKDDRIVKADSGLLKLSEAYDAFTVWYNNNALGNKAPSKIAFKKEMDKSCLKNCYQVKGTQTGWLNWALKKEETDDNDEATMLSKSEL
jgi:P4 family phage/plasmid primase-like protien